MIACRARWVIIVKYTPSCSGSGIYESPGISPLCRSEERGTASCTLYMNGFWHCIELAGHWRSSSWSILLALGLWSLLCTSLLGYLLFAGLIGDVEVLLVRLRMVSDIVWSVVTKGSKKCCSYNLILFIAYHMTFNYKVWHVSYLLDLTSPDWHADFCNALPPTDLNFGPLFPIGNPTQ